MSILGSFQNIRGKGGFLLQYPLFIASYFICYLLLFGIARLVFALNYLYPEAGVGNALVAALPMDATVAAYFSVLPAISAFIAGVTASHKTAGILRKTTFIYSIVTAVAVALILSLDFILYGYWSFRIDSTPLFYFASSPASAMASSGVREVLLLICGLAGFGVVLIFLQRKVLAAFWPPVIKDGKGRVVATVEFIFTLALLFIFARGGVTVSTMNPSRVYKSANEKVNHTALNPVFTLLYSLSHRDNFDSKYQYFKADELSSILAEADEQIANPDSVATPSSLLTDSRPDIYIIILESFSSHLFPSLGGEAVATGLDSIMQEGLAWMRMYASGFRTDRGIPAILSGWPAAPDVSVMKYVSKAEKLPGIASALGEAGYDASYFYGGDANFTNMGAYLRATGFTRIVSDKDFPIGERLSKWGAHDDVLFEKVKKELVKQSRRPQLRVIQTSSSHEPFEVPYNNAKFSGNPRANSFAFTDSVATDFINCLRHSKRPYLVVVVSDHWGAYPESEKLQSIFERHHIPFFIAGNALKSKGRSFSLPASQTDIPASLMALLGLDASRFEGSNNLFAPTLPGAVWMTDRETLGIVSPSQDAELDLSSGISKGDSTLLRQAKARLQQLYLHLSEL